MHIRKLSISGSHHSLHAECLIHFQFTSSEHTATLCCELRVSHSPGGSHDLLLNGVCPGIVFTVNCGKSGWFTFLKEIAYFHCLHPISRWAHAIFELLLASMDPAMLRTAMMTNTNMPGLLGLYYSSHTQMDLALDFRTNQMMWEQEDTLQWWHQDKAEEQGDTKLLPGHLHSVQRHFWAQKSAWIGGSSSFCRAGMTSGSERTSGWGGLPFLRSVQNWPQNCSDNIRTIQSAITMEKLVTIAIWKLGPPKSFQSVASFGEISCLGHSHIVLLMPFTRCCLTRSWSW